MRILQWCGLGGVVAACSGQHALPPEVQLKHQHDQAYQQQVRRLRAEAVNFSTTRIAQGDSSFTVLNLEVLNPQDQPARPDTLRQRVRRLAHLVAIDLANPTQFKAMNVRVIFQHGYFFARTTSSQSFIYSLASPR